MMGPEHPILDLVGVDRTGEHTYTSRSNPQSMGNFNGTAYGGCALANLVHAAYQSLPLNRHFHLYSVVGHFLGPALCDRKIFATVTPYRNTRTFFTCRVELRQKLDSGEERGIMTALCDFMAAEPSLLEYSAPPSRAYTLFDQIPDTITQRQQMVDRGEISEKFMAQVNTTFGLGLRYMEQRTAPEGVGSQNMLGFNKQKVTTQDHLSITEKTSADYMRVRDAAGLKTPAEQFAAAAFVMDMALSFMPLTHNHQFLDDAGACSSLDFALRFFKRGGDGGFNVGDWFFREMKTINGAEGRTYTEGRMWDANGDMVSSMTQQGIMRLPRGGAKTLKL